MIISRKLGTALVALAVVLVILVGLQVWQTSRLAAIASAQQQAEQNSRRAEASAIQQEFLQAKAPTHPL